MGSPDVGTDYESTRGRIDTALATLRQQLIEMQKQDVALLRQLMNIHTTIQTLTGRRDPYRRSLSSGAVTVAQAMSPYPVVDNHHPLVRLQSAPNGRVHPPEDLEDATEDEEDDEEDLLVQSFSSYSTEPLEWSLDLSRLQRSSTTDTLPPIPHALRRQVCAPINETPESEVPSPPDSPPEVASFPPTTTGATPPLELREPASFLSEIVPRGTWLPSPASSKVSEYEPSYETILKRSSQLWRDVKRQREENGTVDQKKMATLKLFL